MRYKILLPLCIFSSLLTLAQNKPDKAFAIVGTGNGNFNWINIQEIDLTSGELTRRVYEKDKTTFELVDGKTKKKLPLNEKNIPVTQVKFIQADAVTVAREMPKLDFAADTKTRNQPVLSAPGANKTVVTNSNQNMVRSGVVVKKMQGKMSNRLRTVGYETPTAMAVAAAAYDQRHNKLFFTPMNFGELRWIDLHDKSSALKVFCLTDEPLTPKDIQNETSQITRMVIAADGNGYALTNDANYFTRFTTGKKPQVTQLGALKDDKGNNGVSIHNRSMYGGDIIADAFGGLYLITASAHVFSIDINSREAKHLGMIQGLPQRYTTNGAAVNNNGDVIVSSANSGEGYFKVDLNSLKAEKLDGKNQPNSSDLATGNLAFDKRKKELSNASLRAIDLNMSNGKVTVFPNPVMQDYFKVNFKQSEAGQYDVQLVELSGKIVFQKRVNVGMRNQTENIVIDKGLAKGVYLIKIVDRSKKLLSSGNIVLQ
jgi:hypothetical protein